MEVGFEGCLDMLMLCACCLLQCTLKRTHTHTHTHTRTHTYTHTQTHARTHISDLRNTRCKYLDAKNREQNIAIKSPPLLDKGCHVTASIRTQNMA